MQTPIKLFLADSYYLFVEGLSMILATFNHIEVVGMACNPQETLYELQSNSCDVLLVDSNFFFQGNEKFGQELKQIYSKKILVLHDSMDTNCLKKIQSQADGFLSKIVDRYQLLETVNAIYNGEKRKILKNHSFAYVNSTYQQEVVARYQLTSREVEVIRLIALEFSSSEIAVKLCVSAFTVDTYRKNIIKKLNARNVASIVNFAHRWDLV